MPSSSISRDRCWIWLKNNPLKDEAAWMGGWIASVSPLGGLLVEHPNYVTARVPDWRVSFKEPSDISQAPDMPPDAQWRLFPVQ